LNALTPEARAETLLRALRDAGDTLADRPVADLVEVLGRVGERFLDPRDPLRLEAETRVALETGFSAPMANAVVAGMASDWSRKRLEGLVHGDFPDPRVLDGFVPGPGASLVRAVGGRLAFHVGAGSVPGVGATSLLRSLLVKCPVLLKPGLGDRALPSLLLRGLEEEDARLACAAAVEYWPGEDGSALETAALRSADRVVVYGGLDTVDSIRRRLPPTTPMVAYHHRISVGGVTRAALHSEESARAAAGEAALAAVLFEQRGCVSPHLIWVEEGGHVSPPKWAALLGESLEETEAVLPAAPLEAGLATEIQQLRAAAEVRGAAGSADLALGGEKGSWTVLFESGDRPIGTCGGRTVRVRAIEELGLLAEVLEPYGSVLQSIAVAGSAEARLGVAERLVRSGITRVTSFRDQPWPPPWWRHDGQGPLLALVRWVAVENDLLDSAIMP
jgi:hypothetical protein